MNKYDIAIEILNQEIIDIEEDIEEGVGLHNDILSDSREARRLAIECILKVQEMEENKC